MTTILYALGLRAYLLPVLARRQRGRVFIAATWAKVQAYPRWYVGHCLHCGKGLTDARRKYCNHRCRMAYYETENARIRRGEAA